MDVLNECGANGTGPGTRPRGDGGSAGAAALATRSTHLGDGAVLDDVAELADESVHEAAHRGLVGESQDAAHVQGGVQSGGVERVLLVGDAHLHVDVHVEQLLVHLHAEVQVRVAAVVDHLVAEELLVAPDLHFLELGPHHFLEKRWGD